MRVSDRALDPRRLVHDEGGTRRENDGAFDTFANSRMLPGQ